MILKATCLAVGVLVPHPSQDLDEDRLALYCTWSVSHLQLLLCDDLWQALGLEIGLLAGLKSMRCYVRALNSNAKARLERRLDPRKEVE